MAKFFIDRPIFAWVIAIIIMLAGLLSLLTLPIEQYPNVAPPTITITATYPGAHANILQDSVAQIIEQNINAIDGLIYMNSSSDASGTLALTLTFNSGTNIDTAQVQVQNKLQRVVPFLPKEVQKHGITVKKSSNSLMMVIGFVNDNNTMTQADISDYISSNIKDRISRIPGVGETQLFGAQYAMRIWLDPYKLNNYSLSVVDIINAINMQNSQVSAGQLGGLPSIKGQKLNTSIIAQTHLSSVEEFSKILIKVSSNGASIRLSDVARVELGSENYEIISCYNNHPASGLGIKLATGANALNTASAIKYELNKLKKLLPSGIKIVYPYDTTPFIKTSIQEVIITLIEAIILVFLVMYLFLQNFRATLIPTIAIPIVLLGTFAIINAFGYSINNLTMFAVILTIGLLVDDAIVVVENIERLIVSEGLSPKEATQKSMSQIQGALIGITLVLSAVFIPMSFFGGSTGLIYRQFSITIVSAIVLSGIVALILTPALCANLLKPKIILKKKFSNKISIFLIWFNQFFDKSVSDYIDSVRHILRNTSRFIFIYFLLCIGMIYLFLRLPNSFLPEEDQGVLLTMVQLPAGATQERTANVLKAVTNYYLNIEKANVNSVFTVNGFGFNGRGQNTAIAFISLKPWKDRIGIKNKISAIIERAMHPKALPSIKDAIVIPFNLPAIIELGTATGFDLQLIDMGHIGHKKFTQARNQLLNMMKRYQNILVGIRANGLEDTPQYKLTIDIEKAQAMKISLFDINTTMSVAWGGVYVNDFIDRGHMKRVYLMGDALYRMLPQDISHWYVRSKNGKMISFNSFTNVQWIHGSPRLERYNGLPSMELLGQPAQGKSSSAAMDIIEHLALKLPTGIGYAWTGISYQERLSNKQGPLLYFISVLLIFLCLAALYESWTIPFSVMLIIPLGAIGALIFTTLRNLNNDVYFIVGMLTTIGLSAKNAILIIEFAKTLIEKENKDILQAILKTLQIRFRPILMTSSAFILGVLPLTISNGAGSGAQNSVGTGVMGGMITATILSVFFVPLFFFIIYRNFSKLKKVSI